MKLAKQWYLHVKDETMAPARMVQFIKQHVAGCPVCREDPDLQDEIEKITEIILPESKIPKAVRLRHEAEDDEDEESGDEDEEVVSDDRVEDDGGEESFEEDDEQPLPDDE